ncbi:scavenger receptor cysteine-rich type 1 protein M130 [Enoplosus armatus]|uniref:scavenger receptor cysteine-rich type 1 protein M130 n=1 Tax=Enoplosus armatus TaxID=215367 RepID=UPI003995A465
MGWERFQRSEKMTINCIENITNLWQCATQEQTSCQNPATVICTGYERVQLIGNASNVCSGNLKIEVNGKWKSKNSKTSPDVLCQQMHCDNVKVVLMDNDKTSRCYGIVHVQVNTSIHPVCASSWTEKNSEVVCKELNCGNVVESVLKLNRPGIMDHVQCSGKESSLWHCRAKRDKTPFQCDSNAHVVCADSVNVRLKDGPGKCAGRVEIQHEGRWKRVSNNRWTDANSNVVCKQLECGNKRNSINPENFSQGLGDFLAKNVNCKSDASQISECIQDSSNRPSAEEKAIGIICDKHKVVFLKGNSSCSGMVGIEHDNKNYWLSGSKETWDRDSANTVCRQMQCGEASLLDSVPSADMIQDVWRTSYNCSSNTTSLFDCEKNTLLSGNNGTIASVTCSGKIQVNLTNGCRGHVNVCLKGNCGGVCADTWTHEKSVMLCKDLGCGATALPAINPPTEHKVIFKSLHTTMQTTSLDQCNLVKNEENDTTCDRSPAYVICSGSVKYKIDASRGKCFGNVAAYYDDQWLPVCTDALDDIKTRNTLCRELKCGQAVTKIDYFGPKAGDHVISHILCSANGTESLAECNIMSHKNSCIPVGLKCSKWSKIDLKVNKACSGNVFVHSEGNISTVSTYGWTETEGEQLCRDLNCGNLKSRKTTTWDSCWNRSFNCSGVQHPENIWDCEKEISPSQQQQQLKLSIECQDEPNVTLSGPCHGEVRMNNIAVCNTGWKTSYSQLVCQEQDCSNAVSFSSDRRPKSDEEYHHVSCEDYHYKLGQCKRFMGKCKGDLVSVYCVGNIKFNTTEKCGGLIEVNYRNKWEKVSSELLSTEMKEKLCQNLGCTGFNSSINLANKNKEVDLKTQLGCTTYHKDIKHCVKDIPGKRVKPGDIYCNGYVIKKTIVVDPFTPPIVPIILGVGFLLVLVIVFVVFLRIYFAKKAKKALSKRKEVEFESGEFEDVTSKANEDFGRGYFRSEAEVLMESDAQSNASFPYDDIDEVAEDRPLTSQAAAGGATDGVTYEVDDPQENYDDIEASPEIAQTEVDVHGSPQTTPENVAAAPPGLVRRDEDYLVPDQDG